MTLDKYYKYHSEKQIKFGLPQFRMLYQHRANGTLDCFMKEMKLQILQTYPQLYSLCCFKISVTNPELNYGLT